jgi:lipoprotein-anchoring transpeptidase ErfK/SrfK
MRWWALAIFAAGLGAGAAYAQQPAPQKFFLFGGDQADKPKGDLPADADPYYSTPEASDKDVDTKTVSRREVADPTHEAPGTLTISTKLRKLWLSEDGGQAVEYRIAVGRQGFSWKGKAEIGRKAYWPGWTPPPEMIERQRDLPAHVDGGPGNPLGARALYLFQDKKDTLFRIHGTNEPKSIGKAVSSGCIRMLNADVIDLYSRVAKGTKVVVE